MACAIYLLAAIFPGCRLLRTPQLASWSMSAAETASDSDSDSDSTESEAEAEADVEAVAGMPRWHVWLSFALIEPQRHSGFAMLRLTGICIAPLES